MDTWIWIVIAVVAALIVLGLVLVLPRWRENRLEQKRAEAAEREARAVAAQVERLQRELAEQERLMDRFAGG